MFGETIFDLHQRFLCLRSFGAGEVWHFGFAAFGTLTSELQLTGGGRERGGRGRGGGRGRRIAFTSFDQIKHSAALRARWCVGAYRSGRSGTFADSVQVIASLDKGI